MERGTISVENQEMGRSILELPDLIVVDILSRLPAKAIFCCRCVCKSWLNLILHPHFAQIQFSRAPIQFLLRPFRSNNLFLAELDDGSCISNPDVDFRVGCESMIDFKTYTTINHQSSKIGIYNSCHGLLCLTIQEQTVDILNITWNPYHIYNPLTGEHIVIPQMVRDSFKPLTCGLGLSGKTKEFKLLRFLSHTDTGILEADIQTLGTNSWRTIGATLQGLRLSQCGPFLNGSLHWIGNGDELIISFDFEEEKFKSLPRPSGFLGKDYMKLLFGFSLGSLGDCLSVCCYDFTFKGSVSLEIWVMNEYGIKESWTKQFVIDDSIFSSHTQPIRYMKNGEILVLCNGILISHNPRRESIKSITFCGDSVEPGSAIPYIPSFIRVFRQGES